MTLKKLLTAGLAGALLVGTIATTSAAELDFAWYAEKNPDVVAEVGDSPEALKQHYEMYGRKEARMANTKDMEAQLRRLFDVEEYAKLYPDVKDFYGEDAEAMFQHYIMYGLLEARRPSEEVTWAVAQSLKKAVEKAMTDAGLEATPGSTALVAVITGDTAAAAETVIDSAVLEKMTTTLSEAVTESYQETTDPKPVVVATAPETPAPPAEPAVHEPKVVAAKDHYASWFNTDGSCKGQKSTDVACEVKKIDWCKAKNTHKTSNNDVGKCSTCGGDVKADDHSYVAKEAGTKTNYKNDDASKHWLLCAFTSCNVSTHTGGTDSAIAKADHEQWANGKCGVCDYVHTPHTFDKSAATGTCNVCLLENACTHAFNTSDKTGTCKDCGKLNACTNTDTNAHASASDQNPCTACGWTGTAPTSG